MDQIETVLRMCRHVALEYFEDGALLLNVRTSLPALLDFREAWIVQQFQSPKVYSAVVQHYATQFEITEDQASDVVGAKCTELLRLGFLQIFKGFLDGAENMSTRYLQNPDVNLREEDEDGALLYNPDTDRVQLLNSTGLFIWKRCDKGHTIDAIVVALIEEFEGASETEIRADTEEFLNQMFDSGFIGLLEATS